MFYGEYTHTLDEKNRIIIPSKFREVIQEKNIEKLHITRGLDACLFIFSENEWKVQENKFKELPFTNENVRRFKRLFFAGASESIPDKQWRILIPDYLKEYAGLEKDIKIIGVSDRIEVWDMAKWEEFYKSSKQDYEKLAEGIII
ncbi:cell division protein MraZ [Candidatus Omnitrophus magneticus]|uniref:Transcriptional regulator MraZ n=1 Tax=Candidatus Omnitrophus magneticus TaxID=1609969 RepID=A0A0F0CRB5_9BACT|nr:cell division protein MraZ [Candidatus Omnitrophus magneticus]